MRGQLRIGGLIENLRLGERFQAKRSGSDPNKSAGISKSIIPKVLLVTGIMVLVTLIPFIVGPQTSNAFAPGAHPVIQKPVSENSMPIYVANSNNPTSAFQYTGMTLSLRSVPGSHGGHAVYDYLHVDSTRTTGISTSNVVTENTLDLDSSSTNLYLYAANNQGTDYGTVGADLASAGGITTLDQYANVNYGGSVNSNTASSTAHCNTVGSAGYPPSVDTGGSEIKGLNLVVTNPAQSVIYEISGGILLFRSSGEVDLVILVNPQQPAHLAFNSHCNDPSVSFSSDVIHWAIRAPPPSNTVSGNYQSYSIVGSSGEKSSGSTPLIFMQEIGSTQTSTSSTSTTTLTNTFTSTSSSASSSTTTVASSSTSSSTTSSSTSSSTTTLSSESSTVSSSTSSATSSKSATSSSSSLSTSGTTTLTTTITSTSTSTCTSPQCKNPYWNANSQEVATYVANNLFNSQVGLIATSSLQGCVDYVGGLPCVDTFWTTSDNVPTGWTLQDFGYSSVTQAIINECNYLQCAGANSGDRYEAYIGWPIAIGSPGDIHGIFSPGSNTITLTCSTSGCGDGTAPYGTLSGGASYKIQDDVWTGSAGSPSPNGPVDVVGPQAINYYIRGDLTDSMKDANALISVWNGYSVDGSGGGDTWHLGQVMFVMRVLGLDTSSNSITTAYGTETYAQIFQQMENELWAIQTSFGCNGGCLPNSYTQASPSGTIVGTGGVDAENQDAGLLPFSYTVVSMVKSEFGHYTLSGNQPANISGGSEIKSTSIASFTILGILSAIGSSTVIAIITPKFARSKELGISSL